MGVVKVCDCSMVEKHVIMCLHQLDIADVQESIESEQIHPYIYVKNSNSR